MIFRELVSTIIPPIGLENVLRYRPTIRRGLCHGKRKRKPAS